MGASRGSSSILGQRGHPLGCFGVWEEFLRGNCQALDRAAQEGG
ncbi:hypothetical protein Nmel_018848, partial [Mimus melanotis]